MLIGKQQSKVMNYTKIAKNDIVVKYTFASDIYPNSIRFRFGKERD